MSEKYSMFTDIPRLIYERRDRSGKTGEDHNQFIECDCACATGLPINLQPVTASTDISYFLDTRNPFLVVPLVDNYYATLGRDTNLIILNRSALTIVNYFRQPHLLGDIPSIWYEVWGEGVIQPTLKQMVTLGLLLPEDYISPTFSEVPITLSAWLHISDRCNLRCAYCFLPHAHVDMSLETGHAAIEATFRSAVAHSYGEVKLKYAGGEPLLRFSFVVELHRYAQTLADRSGLSLDGVILSNGTRLTTKIVRAIQSLGLRLMISLDGLGEVHDRQRPYVNGRGSAIDATKAIGIALAEGLIPDISITVSQRNAEGLPELIAWVLERDLPFSLNFYRKNNFSVHHLDLQLEEEKIINSMLAAYKVIGSNLPRRSLLASLIDRANLSASHLRTCGVGHSYLVFDHLGQVAKCQMQINKPITASQVKDPLALVRADKIGIQNISVEEKEACRSCEWKYWCTGGCPLGTYKAIGRYDTKSPNCNIYKTLYPEAVRLEGRRLLKYFSETTM